MTGVAKIKNPTVIGANKGFLSSTFKQFKLGLLTKGEWIGEEIVIYRDDPMPFTVIAQSKTIALEISKEDFFSKLPKDYLMQLKEVVDHKQHWFVRRMKDITTTSH